MEVSHRSRKKGGNCQQRTHLTHASINHKVCPINEATLVASEEQDSLRLFDSFTESASGKVNLTSMSLGCIVA